MMIGKLVGYIYYATTYLLMKKQLGHLGEKSMVHSPAKLDNAQNIFIGNNVQVHYNSWLMGGDKKYTLVINDGTAIGHYSHIIAKHEVLIEESVLIADKVFISDCTHNYEDINVPIINQGVSNLKGVKIGKGSWIGENVCIMGASVGEHSVVAANAVVVKDIPDYSIAAGVPAKVIKKYDFSSNAWIDVEK